MKSPTRLPIIHDYINGMQGIANGKTGTLRVPGDFRYHNLTLLCYIAGVLSDPTTVISSIGLYIGKNNRQIWDVTPGQLIGESKMMGIIPGTGECPLPFTDPDPKKPRAIQELTSWDLFGEGDLTLKVNFLNPGGGAVDCKVLGEWDRVRNLNPNGTKRYAIMKRVNYSEVLPLGQKNVTDIDDGGYPLHRLYFTPSAGDISDALITVDGVTVFQRTKSENQDDLNRYGWDGTQFTLPVLFDKTHKLSDFVRGRNIVIRQNSTQANTTTVHVVSRVNGFK